MTAKTSFRSRNTGRLLSLGSTLILLAAWEILPRTLGNLQLYFPPVSRIIASAWDGVVSGQLLGAAFDTTRRALTGLALAFILGLSAGLVMGLWSKANALFVPVIEFLRPIPSTAMVPVALLFLGIGEDLYLAVIAFGCAWPILLNTFSGVRSTDPLLIETGRTLNLSRLRIVTQIVIPSAVPQIATGVRISLAISLILAITIEMVAGGSGLGYAILDAERSFAYRRMYAGILVLGVLGLLLNHGFQVASRKSLHWAERSTDII
jgi:NitT/TauT family transport system permease protein